MAKDTSPKYWKEFTNLQHTKHALIREYLNGWFPKLGLWSGRIVYLDTHAGRGQHEQGQSGSPVVAIETLLQHQLRDRILDSSEVRFMLIEHDPDNVDALKRCVAALGELPARVHVNITADDCYAQIEALLQHLESGGKAIAPAFVFVDPYGFKVPGTLLARLLAAGRVELIVNVIWRELDMAIAQAQGGETGGMAETLDLVFGDDRWRRIDSTADVDARADQAIDLLRVAYGARWVTSVRMLGANNATRYILAHFTNHDHGRDLMKDCVWKICPDGGFHARRSDNPNQTRLIVPEPDLKLLEEWLREKLATGPQRWSQLKERLRGELWRNKHLSEVIRALRRGNSIQATGYDGRFSEKADPILSLAED